VSWRNELVTRTEKGEDGAPVLMPRVTIVDADKISDEAAAAVAEVSQTVNGALRVKLHDKHAALVSLGKHLGMFVPPGRSASTSPAICSRSPTR
jgi:phage terminase small subunit